MMATALRGKFIEEKRVFEIEMTKGQVLEIESSGLFDTERELREWAKKNNGLALGYIDGSESHQYILIYGPDMYDVIAE